MTLLVYICTIPSQKGLSLYASVPTHTISLVRLTMDRYSLSNTWCMTRGHDFLMNSWVRDVCSFIALKLQFGSYLENFKKSIKPLVITLFIYLFIYLFIPSLLACFPPPSIHSFFHALHACICLFLYLLHYSDSFECIWDDSIMQ